MDIAVKYNIHCTKCNSDVTISEIENNFVNPVFTNCPVCGNELSINFSELTELLNNYNTIVSKLKHTISDDNINVNFIDY